MRISRSATYAVGVLAAAALIAGCSGNSSGSAVPPSAPNSVSPSGHAGGGMGPMGVQIPDHHSKFPGLTAFRTSGLHVHSDHHKSWVSPDVKKAPRILFVSDDSTNDVYIYLLPNFKLKGTLTGFYEPQGMCSDSSGNIWITNTLTSQIFQYSRTGTLMKTLSDPGYYPVGCAVNKTNGDVAVTNIVSTSGYPGNVMIYANGTGSGTPITNSNQYEYFFPTYDTSGNLYVDGFSNSFIYILSECSSSSCSTMNVSGGTLYFPGGLNWDRVNNNLVAGDQECNAQFASCQYQMTVSGSTATITGSTQLADYNGGACDVDQGTLAPFSRYFAGPCIDEYGTASSIAGRWAYPAGGDAGTYSILTYPIGSAISNK
jgi:hypothetical protein